VALERAVEALAAQRRSARAAYALTALLPPPAEATGAVCVHQGRMHLNYGGGALTCELLPGAVSGIELAKRPAGLRGLRLHGPAKPDEQSALAELAAGASLALEFAPGAPAGWGDPGDPLDRADTVNLLQGDFARPAGVGHLLAWLAQASANGAWRAPAAWTLAIVLVSLAGLNAYWWKLESQAGALRSAMQRSFREALPQEHAVIDELAQAQRAVQALRLRAGQPSPGDFGVLNAAAARLLAQVPAGAVRNLEYASGTLKVGVRAGTLDDGALRGRLQTAALAAGLVFAVEGPETLRLSANGEGP
jgi:general secretion pathway protein L